MRVPAAAGRSRTPFRCSWIQAKLVSRISQLPSYYSAGLHVTNVKALYVLQCRDFILDTHGDSGIDAVKAQLDPAAREQLYSPTLVATDWIDVNLALAHALAYDRAFGTGVSGQAAERMLAALVAKHYTVMYRSVFALADSPESVLEKSSRLWRRFYDSGDTQLLVQSPTSVIKRITGCDLPARHEILLLPYYEELLRQWGARDPMARHTKCVARGAECCETVISWRRSSLSTLRGP